MHKNEGGSIDFLPKSFFNIHHHYPFGLNIKSRRFEFNENPYGDQKFSTINDFSINPGGFSFLRENRKTPSKETDKSALDKAVTEYISSLIKIFDFSKESNTSLNSEWEDGKLVSAKFASWEKGFSSDFLSLEHEGGILYTGSPPLLDRNVVNEINFHKNKIILTTESGTIEYKCGIQSDVLSFIKKYFQIGLNINVS